MIIESIELFNFRQYQGKQIIEFSTDRDKNVTVILGQNTGGKTTLVQAFTWALYGVHSFKEGTLLNLDVLDSLEKSESGTTADLYVTVYLKRNGKKCEINRKITFRKLKDNLIKDEMKFVVLTETDSGSMKPMDFKNTDSKKFVNEILPQDLASYFFYLGESIEKLGERKNLDSAVKQYLGLESVSNAVRHLKKTRSSLMREAGSKVDDQELTELKNEIDLIRSRIDSKNVTIDNLNNSIELVNNEIITIDNELESPEIMQEEEFRNKLNELKQEEAKANGALSTAEKYFRNNMNKPNGYIDFLSASDAQKAVAMLEQFPDEIQGWSYIDIKSIQEIIEKHVCICGTIVEDGNAAYQHLKEQEKKVAPYSIDKLTSNYVSRASEAIKNATDYIEVLKSLKGEIDEYEAIIDNNHIEQTEIQNQTGNADKIIELKKRREEAKKKLDHYKRQREDQENEKRKLERDKYYNTQRYEEKIKEQEEYREVQHYIAYTDALIDDLDRDSSNKQQEIRERLLNLAQHYFDEMYHGNRKLLINDRYQLTAQSSVGGKYRPSSMSQGLEVVKNFAFLAALIELAIEKVKVGDQDISQDPYPLVLDAPFSQADEKHIPAIANLISKIAEQVVIVVMEKDWNYAKSDIEEKVGMEYEIEKISEIHSVIRRVH